MATAISPLFLPLTGTHSVQIGSSLKRKFASLDPASAEGSSGRRQRRRQEPAGAEFHAVQFGRQPESVDPSRGSDFGLVQQLADGAAKIQVERQSASGEKFVFTGLQQPSKGMRDCLLLWDPVTQTFTLELLASSSSVTYDRSATNAAKRQAGQEVSTTPSLGGASNSNSASGSGSGVQSAAIGADEPTPLDLGEAEYGDMDADGEPDVDVDADEELRLDESPLNRDTNTSDETYVNADIDPDQEEPDPVPASAPGRSAHAPVHAGGAGRSAVVGGGRRQPAYEEIDMGGRTVDRGYLSEGSDILGVGDAEGEGELDAEGVTDADAEGVTDADAEGEEVPVEEGDADEELDDFLLADLTAQQEQEQEQEQEEEQEVVPEPEPEPEPRSRRRRSSNANSSSHGLALPPTSSSSRAQPPALRPLALPTTRRMSLRSATTQPVGGEVTSASTLPEPAAGIPVSLNGLGGGEKKWDDDSDSDSEDDDDDEDEEGVEADVPATGAGAGREDEGDDSDFDFLAADMQQQDEDGEGDWDEEGGAGEGQEESPLAKQSARGGRAARQLDIWGDDDE